MENIENTELYKQALTGDALAQYNLACKYDHNGQYGEAFFWFEKSALGGNPRGMYGVAYYYYEGRYVTEDKDLSFYWYKKAAEAGSYHAQRDIVSYFPDRFDRRERIRYLQMRLNNPELDEVYEKGYWSNPQEEAQNERKELKSEIDHLIWEFKTWYS